MTKQFKKYIREKVLFTKRKTYSRIHNEVRKLITPDNDMIVLSLVMNTQNMGLERGTYVEFAPTKGMVGPCKLSGNSIPYFEYKVFHAKPVMEFIKVTVEVAKPDRISFLATVESKGTADPKDHGKEMDVTEDYKKPFMLLAEHLYNYFPHYRNPVCQKEVSDGPV